MDKKHLSLDTLNKMRAYSWPGNIRELENKLMQASLLTTDNEISYADLDLIPQQNTQPDAVAVMPFSEQSNLQPRQNTANPADKNNTYNGNNSAPPSITGEDGMNGYMNSDNSVINHEPLGSQDSIVDSQGFDTSLNILPSEQWCTQFSNCVDGLLSSLSMHTMLHNSLGNSIELLLLNMAQKERGSHAKTAVLLQLPTSTARRKLQKALPDFASFENDSHWQSIIGLLNDIVATRVVLDSPVDIVRQLIAKSILKIHTSNMALASQLMGVSEPTMYKLRKQLQ